MQIGTVKIDGRLVLAPMAGVTDLAFRRICREHGAALTVTEMVSTKALCYQDRKTPRLLELAPDEHPAAALAEISEEHRRIVLLRDVSGMSYSEIAEILEISEGTVKSRLARARIALRRILLQRGNILPLAPSNHEKGGETHE